MHRMEPFTRVLGDSHERKLKELACASSDEPNGLSPLLSVGSARTAPAFDELSPAGRGLGGVARFFGFVPMSGLPSPRILVGSAS
jgi:hypothetical protein